MKKKTPARSAAKRAAPKKHAVKAAAKKAAPKKPAAKQARPAAKPEPKLKAVASTAPVQAQQPTLPLPHRPGLHLPLKPAPAYAQMIQREWAHKPPPHKLTK
jgi:hypothetical protein